MSEQEGIMTSVAPDTIIRPKNKVTVIGVGRVGMAIALSVMTKKCVNILALIDKDENKCHGEVLDLQQGSQFLDSCVIIGGKDYTYSAHSSVVFIAAGVRQHNDETKEQSRQRLIDLFKEIIPEVVRYSPSCVIVVVSNPVDLLTQLTWKISGFPRSRVIGTGTLLDSARLRNSMGIKLGLSANSIHGHIIGKHGKSSIAVWNKMSIGGVEMCEVYPQFGEEDDPRQFNEIFKQVKSSAKEIIRLKGYSSWAMGLCCAHLCVALLNERHVIMPLSVNVKGIYGIEYDVFMSMPCAVNSNGVTSIVNLPLKDDDIAKWRQSAESVRASVDSIEL